MRQYLVALSLLLCTGVSAQTSPDSGFVFTAVELDTIDLLTQPAWEELPGSDKAGYLLSFAKEGNFDEDAVSESARKFRHLLGRYVLNHQTATLTLSVDGLMGRGLVESRYLRGRDYYIDYKIITLSRQELVLKDVKTGEKRAFMAVDRSRLENQAKKRLPKSTEQPTFKLPDFGGR